MKIESDRIFLDTNVLVYSTFEDYDKAKHLKCTKAIADLTASGKFLCISPQVLREFFAVSTNKNIFKKPLTCRQAAKKIGEFMDVFTMIYETENTIHKLLDLLEEHPVDRQKIHDMNIIATMRDNGVSNLMTFNYDDFKAVKEITIITI